MALVRKLMGVAATAATLVLVAGCAESASGGSGGSGEGVALGASMEEYQAAFENVDDIVLYAQSPNAQGSLSGRYIEAYHAAIEEWSGDKITFDVVYSNGVADPVDTDAALADGRLDIAQVYPAYAPQEYPANTALVQSIVASDASVIEGALSANAWPLELAASNAQIQAEFEDHGMKPLAPFYFPGATALYCTEARTSLSDLENTVVAAGGASQVAQLEAIGAAPVSMGFSELYEGLQRGVTDCALASFNSAANSGIAEVAPNVSLDPQQGFAGMAGAMAMSLDTWESLPLVAQQLLIDRMDVFWADYLDVNWEITADASTQIQEAGGEFFGLDDDARESIQGVNEELLDEAAQAFDDPEEFLAQVADLTAEWDDKVSELGYENEVDFDGFGEWFDSGQVDLEPIVEEMFDSIHLETRPE